MTGSTPVIEGVVGGGFWVLSRNRRADTLIQSNQTFPAPRRTSYKRRNQVAIQKTQASDDVQLALELGSRSDCESQKPREVLPGRATAALGDIRRDRHGSAPDLGRDSVPFGTGKSDRHFIDVGRQLDALVPNVELLEVLHHKRPTMRELSVEPLHTEPVTTPTTHHPPPNTAMAGRR